MVKVELQIYNVEKSSIPNERVKRAVTSIVIMAPLHRSSSSPLFSLVNRRAAHRRSTSAKPIQSLWTRTWPFSCRYGTMAGKVTRWQNLIPSFPWIVPGWRVWGRNPRKGRDQILLSGNTGRGMSMSRTGRPQAVSLNIPAAGI